MRLVAALCWSALAPLSLLGALEGGPPLAPSASGTGAAPTSAPGLAPDRAEGEWLAYVREHRDGGQLEEARRYFEGRIAADLREPAIIEPTGHRLRLVAAANAGSLSAATRLVALSWWSAMQRVDILRPQLAAWKDSAAACDGMVAGQVYAQLWLEHQGRHLDYVDAFPGEARAQWLALAGRWPLRHPVLLANACWLCLGNQPVQPERGDEFLQQALVALANDPLLVGDDLLACEGRALAYARCAPLLESGDHDAAVAIFAAAFARNSERGAWAGAGIDRAALLMLPFSDGDSVASQEPVREALAEAESLFARAGDIVRQGRCQTQLISSRHMMIPATGPDDRAALDARYRGAASLCRRAGDWLGYATALQYLGWCMLLHQDGDGWPSRGDEVFGEAATAFDRADEPQQRAYCLHCQVLFLVHDHMSTADRRAVAALQREVEASFALTEVVSARVANLCDLGDSLAALQDRGAALQAYRQAVELVRQGSLSDFDLLRRVRRGVHDLAE